MVQESGGLIYNHKEQVFHDCAPRYPARHYIMVDDKLGILVAMKQVEGAAGNSLPVPENPGLPRLSRDCRALAAATNDLTVSAPFLDGRVVA